MTSVTVIGAGVAGCTSGYLLSERGYDVTIVEKDAIGGLLRDIEFEDGTYCDSAPHLLFFDKQESAVKSLFSKFSPLTELQPYAKSFPRGILTEPHDYPVTRSNARKWDDSEAMIDQLESATEDPQGDTFDEFVTEQVGQLFYKRYFREYTSKHWGVDPTRITGDWFDYKINFPRTEEPFFGDSNVFYPERKYYKILEDMIADCTVEYDEVTGFETEKSTIQGLETVSGETYESDIYVNTIDPSIIADTDRSMNYRSMVIVGVQAHIDTDSLFPKQVYWGYFPNDYKFTRLTEYSFTDQEFEDQEFVMTFEFPCFTNEDLWEKSDDWFESYIIDYFEDQGLDIDIIDLQVRRAPRAYPLPVEEEIFKFEKVHSQLTDLENFNNLGRVSTYQYIWIKDIVEQAYDTVDTIEAEA